jgi:WD40 repeat protein
MAGVPGCLQRPAALASGPSRFAGAARRASLAAPAGAPRSRAAQLPRRGAAAPRGRAAPLRVLDVAQFQRATEAGEALLCAKFRAHSASLAGLLVLADGADQQRLVTTSLDKTVAAWSSEAGSCSPAALGGAGFAEVSRLTPPGGPVFSLLLDEGAAADADPDAPARVYLGNHARQVLAWAPPVAGLEPGVELGGHCGWVRALAAPGGRWLVSAACTELRVWDLARAVPTPVGAPLAVADKGDVLALAASRARVYAAGADGSIRAFSVGRGGELSAGPARARAHGDRVTALALAGGLLFSASYDGSIRAWDPETLEIVAGAGGAHGGERVHCLAAGPDGLLYSGGGDRCVRRWAPRSLLAAAPPLLAHSHSVRALAAGPRELVVSGDKGGEVAVWKVT